jgi:hypothetical protein
MDMTFRDDECRIRTELHDAEAHGAQFDPEKRKDKDSLRLKRKTAAWDDDFLASLVAA